MSKENENEWSWDKLWDGFRSDPVRKSVDKELGLGSAANKGIGLGLGLSLGSTGGSKNSTGVFDKIMAENYAKNHSVKKDMPADTTKEKGLGSIFDSETMKTIGDYAKTGTAVLGLYTGLDNLFGSGAKDRRESKRMMKQSFEQNYAMNDMTMKKFREDNNRFKADRERITSSYMS